MSEIKTEKKIRKHVILSIPALAAILLFIYQFAVFAIADEVSNMFLPQDYASFFVAFVGILLIIIHRLWFLREYKGSFLFDAELLKKVLIPITVFTVIDLFICSYDGFFVSGFNSIKVNFISDSLYAAICEEVGCRVLIMTTLLRVTVKKNSYFPALLVSTLIFGLAHFFNIAMGAGVYSTVLQVIETIACGLLLGAVFLRTGNILYPMIIHFLHDIVSFTVAGEVLSSSSFSVKGILLAASSVILSLGVAFWLLKGHKDDIISLWKDRWSIED